MRTIRTVLACVALLSLPATFAGCGDDDGDEVMGDAATAPDAPSGDAD